MKDYSNKKILIFSDTHLKCNFDENWFLTIKSLIEKADLIIINGDFWENMSCDFDNFIQTKWRKKLFPLLKEKTILIHGNHDDLKCVKNRKDLRLFSFQNLQEFEFKSGDKIFHLRHGHILSRGYKDWRDRIIISLKKKKNFIYYFMKSHEKYFSFIYNSIGRGVIKFRFKPFVKKQNNNKIYIFGHIHLQKHNIEDNFIVLGSFKDNKKRYILIENGSVKFFNDKY